MKYEFSEEFLHTMGDLLGFCVEKGTDTLEITFDNPEKYSFRWSVEMTFKVDTKSEKPSKQ